MGLFDSFYFYYNNFYLEEQTKKFDSFMKTHSIGHFTELEDIQLMDNNNNNIKIISIEKNDFLSKKEEVYQVVFFKDYMVDYNIINKSEQNKNKKQLMSIWSDPILLKLGLLRTFHINNYCLNIIKSVEKEIKLFYCHNSIKKTDLRNYCFDYCLQDNGHVKKEKEILNKISNLFQERKSDIKINIEITGKLYDNICEKGISAYIKEILTKKGLSNFQQFEFLFPSTIFNPEKAYLVKKMTEEELRSTKDNQAYYYHLIVNQGVNEYFSNIILQKLNYKNIDIISKYYILNSKNYTNTLYKKLNIEDQKIDKEKLFCFLKEYQYIPLYPILFFVENNNIGLFDRDSKGESFLSVLSKKNFLEQRESILNQKLKQYLESDILKNSYINNAKTNHLILLIGFIETIDKNKHYSEKDMNTLYEWTFLDKKTRTISTEKDLIYNIIKTNSDRNKIKKETNNNKIKSRKEIL